MKSPEANAQTWRDTERDGQKCALCPDGYLTCRIDIDTEAEFECCSGLLCGYYLVVRRTRAPELTDGTRRQKGLDL